MKKILSAVIFILFVGTIYAANWALATFGVVSLGFGLVGPAGVYFAGLAFGLRDALHELGGIRLVLIAIATGTVLSYIIEDGSSVPDGIAPIAVASAAAFALSEILDLAVYTPLRNNHWPKAVIASNTVGAIVDSAVFLFLAFGSLQFIVGQTLGKAVMIFVALPLVWIVRRRLNALLRNIDG